MEVSRVFQLLDAGYTREQIDAFERGLKETQPTEEPTEPTETTQPSEREQELTEQIKSLETALADLTKTVQESNIRNKAFEQAKVQTADDVLAEVFGGIKS